MHPQHIQILLGFPQRYLPLLLDAADGEEAMTGLDFLETQIYFYNLTRKTYKSSNHLPKTHLNT